MGVGAVYGWSVFQQPLLERFPSWSERQVTLPAQLVLAVFALAVIVGGRLSDRCGARTVAGAGGVILGAGLVLASLAGRFSDGPALLWTIVCFAGIGGWGIGFGYIAAVTAAIRSFPEKRGTIIGLTVAGFGAGAFLFAPLAQGLISGEPYRLLGVAFFRPPRLGVLTSLAALGIVFCLLVTLAARLLHEPRLSPRSVPVEIPESQSPSLSPPQMTRTWLFWLLWTTLAVACAAGLLIIMKAAPIWRSLALSGSGGFLSADELARAGTQGALAVSLLGLGNALGRILGGALSDLVGRKAALAGLFLTCATAFLALGSIETLAFYLAASAGIAFCYGGLLAVYPVVTADLFGTEHYGAHWGWMFSAYGVGGFLGPYLAARLSHIQGFARSEAAAVLDAGKQLPIIDYRPVFFLAAATCAVSAVALLLFLKRSRD